MTYHDNLKSNFQMVMMMNGLFHVIKSGKILFNNKNKTRIRIFLIFDIFMKRTIYTASTIGCICPWRLSTRFIHNNMSLNDINKAFKP